MKIVYPHLGTLTMVAEQLIEEMGHEPVTPDRPTRQTLALGARYSPEFACIPFKTLPGHLPGRAGTRPTPLSAAAAMGPAGPAFTARYTAAF